MGVGRDEQLLTTTKYNRKDSVQSAQQILTIPTGCPSTKNSTTFVYPQNKGGLGVYRNCENANIKY